MVATLGKQRSPFGLVVTGQAEFWTSAIKQIVGPKWLRTYEASSDRELIEVVESGQADAAVLDDSVDWELDVLHLLRMIRRLDQLMPVVVVTVQRDRRWLESALRLAAFSVVIRPLELEELLRQIQRIMFRLDASLREQDGM